MMAEQNINPVKKLSGIIKVPADKSISHRALMIGSLAKGTTTISNLLESSDVMSTLNCLRDLGVAIEKENDVYKVNGKGKKGFSKPDTFLNVGNSGTTLRMLPGIIAGQELEAELSGDESVNSRPMERVLKPLRMMGAVASSIDGHAPIKINGANLKAIDYKTEVPSAQVKSAILLAGLLADGQTCVTEDFKSRDHTEIMLSAFGANICTEENKVIVDGASQLSAQDIVVPGDFSSAAFFIAAALLIPNSVIEMPNIGINPTRSGMGKVLKRMGVELINATSVEIIGGETVSNIKAGYTHKLVATSIKSEEIPSLIDELPIIAVIATRAQGITKVSGAGELRVKESDRITCLAGELKKMGAKIIEQPDGFEVEGPVKLKGAEVDSHDDHRIAMALSIAGLIAEGKTIIKDSDCVNISFPGFFKMLESVKD